MRNMLFGLIVDQDSYLMSFMALTVYSDVNSASLSHPPSCRDKEVDLAVEQIIFVLLLHHHVQLTLDSEKTIGSQYRAGHHLQHWKTRKNRQGNGEKASVECRTFLEM